MATTSDLMDSSNSAATSVLVAKGKVFLLKRQENGEKFCKHNEQIVDDPFHIAIEGPYDEKHILFCVFTDSTSFVDGDIKPTCDWNNFMLCSFTMVNMVATSVSDELIQRACK